MKTITSMLPLAITCAFAATTAFAQGTDPHAEHRGHGQDTPEKPKTDRETAADHNAMDHASMGHDTMSHAPEQPRTPIPAITDADRAAANRPLKKGHAHGSGMFGLLRFNRLEAWNTDHGTGQQWEGTGWLGGDINRVWIRSEGERTDGVTESADLEVLYGQSVSTWWDVLAGVRHDFKPGHAQTFAAFGVQGLAPQKFEVKATLYLGEQGQAELRAEAEREIPLTGKWVLQPLIEANFNAREDRTRGLGSGLSTIETGLRLRYEITRRFAPYIGIVNERAFGATADFRREEGEHSDDTRIVAGVRVWF